MFIFLLYSGPSCARIKPEAVEIAKMHTVGTVAMLLSSQPHRPIARHRCEENVKLYFISQHLIIIPLCRHQKTL